MRRRKELGKDRPVTCSFPRLVFPYLYPRLAALSPSASWRLFPPCSWRPQAFPNPPQHHVRLLHHESVVNVISLLALWAIRACRVTSHFPGLVALMCLARCGSSPSAWGLTRHELSLPRIALLASK